MFAELGKVEKLRSHASSAAALILNCQMTESRIIYESRECCCKTTNTVTSLLRETPTEVCNSADNIALLAKRKGQPLTLHITALIL